MDEGDNALLTFYRSCYRPCRGNHRGRRPHVLTTPNDSPLRSGIFSVQPSVRRQNTSRAQREQPRDEIPQRNCRGVNNRQKIAAGNTPAYLAIEASVPILPSRRGHAPLPPCTRRVQLIAPAPNEADANITM